MQKEEEERREKGEEDKDLGLLRENPETSSFIIIVLLLPIICSGLWEMRIS
ncbi:hypothetical protein BVRB_7g170380 [Beta vulgaris subsp. vulgaris]|nr:hypothetical protein BVRB_7g170380 [Beta vulgaris subsp. vulgaris]